MSAQAKTWTKTRFPNLYRHESGVYYARLRVNGKPTWRSLQTELLSIAKEEVSKLVTAEKQSKELNQTDRGKTNMTLAEAAEERLKEIGNDPSTKASTKKYWREIHDAILSSWGDLPTEIKKISVAACQEWAGAHSKKMSPTRFNNALGALKNIFDLTVRKGVRFTNPAKEIKRVKPKGKDLTLLLPEPELFSAWVKAIRSAPSRWSEHTADFVEFLSYSGVRPESEGWNITWRHCDFRRNELVVTGEPEEGTKNRTVRRVPMNANLRALLEKMREARKDEPLDTPVLQVKSAREAMARAGKLVGMQKITQYDLRHLFTTRCVESGVDIPTVAKWLGHKDGGALLMRTYNHVRNKHSHEAAKQVTF
jgi:integrase